MADIEQLTDDVRGHIAAAQAGLAGLQATSNIPGLQGIRTDLLALQASAAGVMTSAQQMDSQAQSAIGAIDNILSQPGLSLTGVKAELDAAALALGVEGEDPPVVEGETSSESVPLSFDVGG